MKSVIEVENLVLPTIELTNRNAKSFLIGILEEEINTLKIQSLTNWESNHDYHLNSNDDLIDELVRNKETVRAFLNQFNVVETKFDIKLSFSICAK